MNDMTDNLLVNLKIISKISPRNRLKLLHSSSTIEPDTMFSWISRWYNGDSRGNTVQFIKSVIADSIKITNDLMNSTYVNINIMATKKNTHEETEFVKALNVLQLIHEEMVRSKVGLKNLQLTYENDIQIVSQLEVQSNKIDGHLGIIERKLQDIARNCGEAYSYIFLKKPKGKKAAAKTAAAAAFDDENEDKEEEEGDGDVT
jgi:hypothetical protein